MERGGGRTPFSRTTATTLATTSPSSANGLQKGDREAAIDAEIARVNKLPACSSYAIHRMKVLNKLRHLLSIKGLERKKHRCMATGVEELSKPIVIEPKGKRREIFGLC